MKREDIKEFEQQLLDDYGFALLTILWAEYSNANSLVFAMLEFYPHEIQECSEIPEDSKLLRDIGQDDTDREVRLHFLRRRMECGAALALYCKFREERWIEIESGESSTKNRIEGEAGDYIEIPHWPDLTTGFNDDDMVCPFVSDSWGCCRMHHFFPDVVSEKMLPLTEYENLFVWIRERLIWDLSLYSELLGSFHLVLPNPILRGIEERMIPGEIGQVSICLDLRSGKTMRDLVDMKLFTIERGCFGMRKGQEISLSDYQTPAFTVELSGHTEEFALMLHDKTRGLLEWSPFGHFLVRFDIDTKVAKGKREVHIPGEDSSYESTIYESAGRISIGGEKPDGWGDRFAFRRFLRTQTRHAEKFGQRFFQPGNPKEAQFFIRELMNQAKQRVIIIDPFFTTVELFRFVLGISSPVGVTILTSADVLKSKSNRSDDGTGDMTLGEELYYQILKLEDRLPGYKISVEVMTGHKPVIHDRFLVIDDQVWFSGNSLNDIGTRMSMLIRLPDPNELLDYWRVLKSGDHIKPLEEWIKGKDQAKRHNDEKQTG